MQTFQLAPRLNFEEIRTFAAVIELGSFSKAADALYRTPAAVSYRINSLEEALGVPLLERTSRGVAPTPAGAWLYDKVAALLIWQSQVPEEIQQIRSGVESKFTLVVNNLLYDSACIAVLLSEIRRMYPYTQLEVIESVFNGVWDALIYQGGSFAVGLPTHHAIDDRFETRPIGEIEWHFVVAPSHPLAKLKALTGQDLLAYPVINIEDSSLQMQKRLPWRMPGQEEVMVPDMATKIRCIAEGVGVGFLPYSSAHPLIEAGRLVEMPLSEKLRSPSPMAIGWPRENLGVIARWMLGLFESRSALIAPLLVPMTKSSSA